LYPLEKVAIVTATVGTAIIEYGPPAGGGFLGGYRDASGDLVKFDTITGFALKADAKTSASQPAAASHFVVSDNDEVAFTLVQTSDVGENFRVQKLSAGTCNFLSGDLRYMISATVNISGSFLDTATTSHTESVKKCFLASAETLSGGKVIVVTGTTDDSGGVTIDPGDHGASAMPLARKLC